MKTNKGFIVNLDLDTGDSDLLTLLVELSSDKLKKRKATLRLTLFDNAGKTFLKSGDPLQYSTYCNTKGEIIRTQLVKSELFGPKNYKLLVPYAAFSQLEQGQIVTAIVELFSETNEQLDIVEEKLVVNFAKRFTFYSAERFVKYLQAELPDSFKVPQILTWFEDLYDDEQTAEYMLRMLCQAAEGKNTDLQRRVSELYGNQRYSFYNKDTAAQWLKKSQNGGVLPADKPAEAAPAPEKKPAPKPLELKDEASAAQFIKAANVGDVEAQWALCKFYGDKGSQNYQPEKAFQWLKTSAEHGCREAVECLANRFYEHYSFVTTEHAHAYLSILQKAAGHDNPEAQFLLFDIYYTGVCLRHRVAIDRKNALSCLLAAAQNGKHDACFQIWDIYENGNDFLMSEEEAIKWLIQAADNGNARAQNRLGDLYVDGKAVEKNGQKGIDYILKAADLKNYDAQIKVYHMHYDGRYKDVLFDHDVEKAHQLLIDDSKDENPMAQKMIWDKYLGGNEMMLTVQEALSYLKRASDQNDPPAVFELANVLIEGEYTQQNLDEGWQMLERASKNGDSHSQFALYQYYYYGNYKNLKCPEINQERAFKWLVLSAEQYAVAQYEMWLLFNKDNDLNLEADEAVAYLFNSAEQQYSPAVYQVGVLFGQGKLIGKNSSTGIEFIKKAVSLRNPEAMYALFQINYNGIFEGEEVEADKQEGIRLLKLSAEYGYAPACYEVWERYQDGNEIEIEGLWADKFLRRAAEQGYAPAVQALEAFPPKSEPVKEAPPAKQEPPEEPAPIREKKQKAAKKEEPDSE